MKFCWFQRLGSNFTRGRHRRCFIEEGVFKISQYSHENICVRVSFWAATLLKKRLWHRGFSCEFCKIFKNTFFTEHLWMTPSILQQLLALYFAITYSWKVSRSEQILVGKKNLSIYLKDFTDLDFFYTDIFFHFLWQMSVYHIGYATRMLYSKQPTVLLARRHLNTMRLTNFENWSSISNIFQETYNFLVLTDPVIICIYLKTIDIHFVTWEASVIPH